MASALESISENKLHGGWQNVYRHSSIATHTDMVFAVYFPPASKTEKVPVLWYLSGLTCTHENAMTKANFQEYAAKHGLAIIYPDTSPRGENIPDDEAYDLGQGAGFYVNATNEPWSANYQMETYILSELPALLSAEFPQLDMERQGIFGHSMGGHGALTLAMKAPDRFLSLSAFAPICHPTNSDWGQKQLGAYLGNNSKDWAPHDASLALSSGYWNKDILVDQGLADNFLSLLMPDALEEAAKKGKVKLTFRKHEGYDHSYFFITSFARDHIEWHAERLNA